MIHYRLVEFSDKLLVMAVYMLFQTIYKLQQFNMLTIAPQIQTTCKKSLKYLLKSLRKSLGCIKKKCLIYNFYNSGMTKLCTLRLNLTESPSFSAQFSRYIGSVICQWSISCLSLADHIWMSLCIIYNTWLSALDSWQKCSGFFVIAFYNFS